VLTSLKPEDVTKEVTASGMLGTAAAFRSPQVAVSKLDDGQPHYLCANADEGEPDLQDRWISSTRRTAARVDADHLLRTAGAQLLRLHPREFDQPYRRLQAAVEEATPPATSARTSSAPASPAHRRYRGAGSYVCGEASALILDRGKKGYPRNRPAADGARLYQRPTVINNVETLSNVAIIMRHGGGGIPQVGKPKSPGTQLVSISGHSSGRCLRVEYGYPLDKFIYETAAACWRQGPQCIIPGGISTK